MITLLKLVLEDSLNTLPNLEPQTTDYLVHSMRVQNALLLLEPMNPEEHQRYLHIYNGIRQVMEVNL